ncbi:MAG: hypothetical protein F6K65_37635 [Moorea sp. SIO3C2]|nr:hypothetical protein [Moorena sp. SIO3C2]
MLTISANQDLFVDLNETDAETISGGYEVFTIGNNTPYNINYTIDGTSWTHKPNETWTWTAYSGGTIKFDEDLRSYINYKQYDLSHGGVYEFQFNNYTPNNPHDIDLYDIA